MPKIKQFKSYEQERIENKLFSIYCGYMTAKDVGIYLGLKHAASYNKFLSDVESTTINGRKNGR